MRYLSSEVVITATDSRSLFSIRLINPSELSSKIRSTQDRILVLPSLLGSSYELRADYSLGISYVRIIIFRRFQQSRPVKGVPESTSRCHGFHQRKPPYAKTVLPVMGFSSFPKFGWQDGPDTAPTKRDTTFLRGYARREMRPTDLRRWKRTESIRIWGDCVVFRERHETNSLLFLAVAEQRTTRLVVSDEVHDGLLSPPHRVELTRRSALLQGFRPR